MTRRLPLRPPQIAPKNRRLQWIRLGWGLTVTVCTLISLVSLIVALADPAFSVTSDLRYGLAMIGLTLGACIGLWLAYLSAQLPPTAVKNIRRGPGRDLSPREARVVMVLIAIPAFGYVPVAQGLPWLLNHQLGQDRQWVSQVNSTGLTHSKNTVSYHVRFEPLADCDIINLPITEGEFKTAHAGDSIELAGRRSRFACVIDQHRIVAKPPVLKQ